MKELVKNWIMYVRKYGLPLDIDSTHRLSMISIIRKLIIKDITLASYLHALLLMMGLIAVIFLVISGNAAAASIIGIVIPMLLSTLWVFWRKFSSRVGFSIRITVKP